MEIRLLQNTDLSQLLAIEHNVQSSPWSAEVFQMCVSAGYDAWVMVEDKLVLGFIIISVCQGECHVLNLGVTKQYQQQGVGRELLEHAMAGAQQQGAVIAYLEVRETNQPALNLYQKQGFASIGRRKGYYPSAHGREDALVLVKDLSQGEMTSSTKLDKLTAKTP